MRVRLHLGRGRAWLVGIVIATIVLAATQSARRVSRDVTDLAAARPISTSYMRMRARATGQPVPALGRWMALSAMPTYVPCAIVKAEDRAFFRHGGFDVGQQWRAVTGAVTGARRMGGSTITQQLARNLFLSEERTLRRKLVEAAYALELERAFDKRAILETYLNVIEWGPGVWGIDAAARHYFGVPPESLSVSQAILLASIIADPRAQGLNGPRQQRVERRVLWQLATSGLISATELEAARATLGLSAVHVDPVDVREGQPATVRAPMGPDCGLTRELERQAQLTVDIARADRAPANEWIATGARRPDFVSVVPETSDGIPALPITRIASVVRTVVVNSYQRGDEYARVYLYPGAPLRLDSLRGDSIHSVIDGSIPLWLPASAVQSPPPAAVTPAAHERSAVPRAPTAEASIPGLAVVHLTFGVTPAIVVVREWKGGYSLRTLGAARPNTLPARSEPLPGVLVASRSVGEDVETVIDVADGVLGYDLSPAPAGLAVHLRRLSSRRTLRVLIDAGHPPHGATGPTGVSEATVTLDIARRLRGELRRRGMTVVMTRERNVPVALGARVAMAHGTSADVVISIHADAPPNGEEARLHTGSRTMFLHAPAAPLAMAVQAELARNLGLRDRGVFRRSLGMTDIGSGVAILCEVAELSDAREEKLLTQPDFQRAAARAIANGVRAFVEQRLAGRSDAAGGGLRTQPYSVITGASGGAHIRFSE